MIELKDIQFSYTKHGNPALTDVSASVEPGIHLLAGENGAGKTTLLHLMAGLIEPRRGECLINGIPTTSDAANDKGKVFLLEENQCFPGKTIREFARRHSHFYLGFSKEIFENNLKEFGLSGKEELNKLSLGNRKKAQLAYVLALGTDVLLLDEPTNGLDISGRDTLRRIICTSIEPQQTLIVATHSVNEFENIIEGAIFIRKSHLLLATTEEIISSKLSFLNLRAPHPDMIYAESGLNGISTILPRRDGEEYTRTDWKLLYNALNSDAGKKIIKYLK